MESLPRVFFYVAFYCVATKKLKASTLNLSVPEVAKSKLCKTFT